jgi:hypothetical protein
MNVVQMFRCGTKPACNTVFDKLNIRNVFVVAVKYLSAQGPLEAVQTLFVVTGVRRVQPGTSPITLINRKITSHTTFVRYASRRH